MVTQNMTDPIADMIIRIKNAYSTGKASVAMPHSRVKVAIAQVLVDEGYLDQLETQGKIPQKQLVITLKYNQQLPVISSIRRVSRPGRRVYSKAEKISQPLSGHGTTIISTSKGIMTGKKAQADKIGGEVILEVW